MSESSSLSRFGDRRWSWLLLFSVLALVVFIRVRLGDMPLERDEGEYALAGQYILKGLAPSNFIYTMKLPGAPGVYALIMALFGQTAMGIHLGLLLVNLISMALVLAIARNWFGGPAACFSAASFAVMSLSPALLGLAAHATHFVALFALVGCWIQVRRREAGSWSSILASGVFYGLAFLMKQTALALVVAGALPLFLEEMSGGCKNIRAAGIKLGLFSLGVLLPYGLVCFWVWRAGAFPHFWFWTVSYAREYATRFIVIEGIQIFSATISSTIGSSLPLWLLGLAGIACLGFATRGKNGGIAFAGLLVASFLSVCPGYYFRQHYFIVMLPWLALFGGAGLSLILRELVKVKDNVVMRIVTVAVAIFSLAYPFWAERILFFRDSPVRACRRVYGANPFPESPVIAKYLADHTDSSSTIAVLGSEPQICFHARRRPATGYIYTYGLMEPQPFARKMQEEMIHEIESAHPQYLVFAKIRTSWLPQRESDTTIFRWSQKYLEEQFELVGLVDIYSEEKTEFLWGLGLDTYSPKSQNLILIYKRKAMSISSVAGPGR